MIGLEGAKGGIVTVAIAVAVKELTPLLWEVVLLVGPAIIVGVRATKRTTQG